MIIDFTVKMEPLILFRYIALVPHLVDRDVRDGLAHGGEDDGVVLGEVLEALQRLLQRDGVVPGEVLHVVALDHLAVLAHQAPEFFKRFIIR